MNTDNQQVSDPRSEIGEGSAGQASVAIVLILCGLAYLFGVIP